MHVYSSLLFALASCINSIPAHLSLLHAYGGSYRQWSNCNHWLVATIYWQLNEGILTVVSRFVLIICYTCNLSISRIADMHHTFTVGETTCIYIYAVSHIMCPCKGQKWNLFVYRKEPQTERYAFHYAIMWRAGELLLVTYI